MCIKVTSTEKNTLHFKFATGHAYQILLRVKAVDSVSFQALD